MNWTCVKKAIIAICVSFFFTIGLLISLIVIVCKCNRETTSTTPPVESIKIDSITTENTKLVIEVKNLDSIKDAKVIEVKSLDNDSTLRLFYRLIGK